MALWCIEFSKGRVAGKCNICAVLDNCNQREGEYPLTKIVRLFRVIMIARSGISTLRVVFCTAVFFQAKLCRCIVRCERRTTFHIELRFQ